MLLRALFLPLALLACVSPLLTYAWLWQLKEWRWDRLREQLKREGVASTLLGRGRPFAVALAAVALLLRPSDFTLVLGLLVLSALSLLPLLRHHQRLPRWTQKALCITAFATVIDILAGGIFAATAPILLLALPLLQPLAIALSWVCFLPVDRFLKHRILGRARSLRLSFPHLTVIGVTGSVGKTTTKELLNHVLQDLQPMTTPAYMNAEIGVARWIVRELSGKSADERGPMIVEMGAYKQGEIALLCDIARPTLGIVTAVGDQHVALFGSPEAIVRAKGELIAALPEDGRAFLNGDQPLVRGMATRARCPVTLVGTGGHLDLEAFEIQETSGGIQFRLSDNTLIQLPMHGTHNVTNVLFTIAVASHLGVSMERIAALLRTFEPPHRTFAVRSVRGVTVLDDTHNASSSSMRAAIAWARTQPQSEKILVTAGLIELGERQAAIERELGALCKGIFKRVIVLDPASRQNFAEGFGTSAELLSTKTEAVQPESLLVCVGRMSEKTVSRLLP